ncbi:MAG: type II toxin-antitoxin system RelE/ParE family toxin [Thermoanaerobaculia bacterium]
MRIALTERFQRDVRALSKDLRATVFEVILVLPRTVGDAHLHTGLGMRKLHASGIWEVRIGQSLRLVFTLEPQVLTLVRVGTHDDVRRFLREL